MIRLFFALDISPDDQVKIWDWCENNSTILSQQYKRIPLKNYHITLAFIGLATPSQTEKLMAKVTRLQNASKHSGSLELTMDHLGLFRKPQVLYLANSVIPEQLSLLQAQLNTLLNQENFYTEERDYLPHISIYRKAKTKPETKKNLTITVSISHYSLYHSKSTNTGVQYAKLATWAL